MAAHYLDTSVVISLVEHGPDRRRAFAAQLVAAGHARSVPVISHLVRLDCRVLPMAKGDSQVLAAYDSFFASPRVRVVPLTAEVCDRATEIRARYRYETADALHLAAAIKAGCEAFVTADRALAAFDGLRVLLVTTGLGE